MKARRGWIAFILTSALSASIAPNVRADAAQDTAIARDLFREGAALAQQGKWDQALNRYARSLKLKRASLTLYSLGVAQKQLGQLLEARESFTAFLAEPSSTATQPFEDPAKAALEEISARIGRLTIQVAPAHIAGLVVQLDGATVPTNELGAARPVNPGTHHITALGPGYGRAQAEVNVPDGGAHTATLTLRLGAPEPIAPSSPSGPASTPPDRVAPAVLIGAGGSIITTGASIITLGLLEYKDAVSGTPALTNAKSKVYVGAGAGGVGLITLGIGVVLCLTQGAPSSEPAPKATGASIRPWASGGASGVQIAF